MYNIHINLPSLVSVSIRSRALKKVERRTSHAVNTLFVVISQRSFVRSGVLFRMHSID